MTTYVMENEQAETVSQTIISQLTHGGSSGRLQAMLGATNISYSTKGRTSFHFKMCRKANICSIQLTDADLYTMTFYKLNKTTLDLKDVKVFEEIYAEDLSRLFTQFTGLDTHL